MKFVFNNDHVAGFDAIFLLIVNTLLVIPNTAINILLPAVAGALTGWLLGLLPLGTWISDGLSLTHATVRSDDLYRVGAALGFVKGFFAIARSSGHPRGSS